MQRRLLLPGNHDRWTRSWAGFQEQGAAFERAFGLPSNYPYVVGLRRPGTANEPDEPAVLFFVFDSTPGAFARFWWWNRLARGRVEHGTLDAFMNQARAIEASGVVRSLGGEELHVRYSNCVRVALLHHHPFDRHRTTLMENAAEFKEYCIKAGIHIVLFGHEHKEFRAHDFGASELAPDANHQVIFFCCPSASEYASEQGFYEFAFDGNGFDFTFHKWLNRQFELGGLDENRFLRNAPQRYHFSRPLQ
ncbi:metallophosphoesterase family protein [Bradyrhizobium sp. UFLA05-112]